MFHLYLTEIKVRIYVIVRNNTCTACAFIIHFAGRSKNKMANLHSLFTLFCCVFAMQTLVETVMFISQMAFFASISDASIGGTYMTLLATLSNLGGTYPSTVALYLLNFFSKKSCLIINLAAGFNSTQSFNSTSLMPIFNESSVLTDNKCSSSNDKECKKMSGD
ncbi:Acetyl-coenzyme A transporter 1, partial [Brachionus plicatilis]